MVNILKGFLSIFGGQVANLLLGMAITPLLVRVIGSDGYGDYAFLISLITITLVMVNAGIFDGTRKFVAEKRGMDHWTEHVIGFYFRVALVLASVAAVIYGIAAWSGIGSNVFGEGFDVYLALVGVILLVRQIYSVSRASLMGLGRETVSEPLQVIRRASFGIIGLLLATGAGVVGVLWGQIISYLLVAIIGFVLVARGVDFHAIFENTPCDFPRRQLLEFNGLSVVLILLIISLYHIDVLLLRPIAGDTATGYYKGALLVAEFLWFAPMALQMSLLQSTSEMWSEGRDEEITDLISRITRFNLAGTALLIVGIGALAGDFLPLYYGPEFEAAVQPLLLLLPGAMGFALARPILAVGQGKGSLRPLIVATGIAACLNLLLNLALIPQFGMTGAAIATSTSYGSMIVLHVLAARRIGYDPLQGIRVLRTAIVAGITISIIVPIGMVIESSIISLLTIPVIGFGVFSAGTLLIKPVPRDDIEIIKDLTQAIIYNAIKIHNYFD